MMPFSFSSGGDKAAADLEREISNFVESGMAKKQADIWNAAVPGQQDESEAPAPAKPKKQPPKPGTWSVRPHTTKRGVKGRIFSVGPFSLWLPDGDVARQQAAVEAVNLVFRHAQCNELVNAICCQ